jgi:hypothetical protein
MLEIDQTIFNFDRINLNNLHKSMRRIYAAHKETQKHEMIHLEYLESSA